MYSKNKLSIVNGLCAGVLVWIILLISDYIDETALDKGFFIGLIIYMIVPVILVCCYIYNYIAYKPDRKKLLPSSFNQTQGQLIAIIWQRDEAWNKTRSIPLHFNTGTK